MSSFSPDWLALREPADRRARSTRVTRAVADALPRDRAIDVLDLAAGIGSNERYLREYFRTPQTWLLVDHDAALLEVARERADHGMTTCLADLSSIGDRADLFRGRDLVTASAFLDLVSDAWLRAMLACCREACAAVLFALTYDGRMVCRPTEPEDDLVRDLVNRHQRTDKGFGAALGPDAAQRASELLESLGYHVVRDPSDWVIGPDADELQHQLIEDWAQAAAAVAPSEIDAIDGWRRRRLAHAWEGRSEIVVGHEDVAEIGRASCRERV